MIYPKHLSANDPRRSGIDDAQGSVDNILDDLAKVEAAAKSRDLEKAIGLVREALDVVRSGLATCSVLAEDEGRAEDGPDINPHDDIHEPNEEAA